MTLGAAVTPSDAPEFSLGLIVKDLKKSFPQSNGAPERILYDGLSFTLSRSDKLALLGRNGQGKSSLIKILGGVLPYNSGVVDWHMSSSWPIGFGGGFQGSLSGLDNVRFLSRIYDVPYEEALERVENFAELGKALCQPVKQYSSGMRARLAFGLSLAIDFDCYLIDELMAVGDARFVAKCNEELFDRRGDRAFVIASHDMHTISRTCDRALIINAGEAKLFSDVDEAIDIYNWLRAP